MEVIIEANAEKAGLFAANVITTQILRKPNLVLGLATGSTALIAYRELARRHKEGGLDFSKVVTFNLDEYLGLPPTHPQSYYHFMYENLFRHINIDKGNIHVPSGLVLDPAGFCDSYEQEIKAAGGIDIQLLGIGRDGHIGFNEPGSSLGSRTRVKTLTRETIADNARFFAREEEVPRFAITMGVGTIMEARHIILVATGAAKADVAAAAVEGPVTASVTASVLQLHPDAVYILDEEAASALKRRDYYRWIQENKHLVNKVISQQIRARLGM
ncbi:MAG TPA: glucosamine-6-phosphate deaminase [Planctomycetota bacterium]|nr:glucosamine-6-phosphate deaminase [Planctomycetota bacterium]